MTKIKRRMPKWSRAVKSLREHMQLTQQGFANVMSVSFATVNRWENGRCVPSSLALKELRRACHVAKCRWLLDDLDCKPGDGKP